MGRESLVDKVYVRNAPVYELLVTASPLHGNHLNKAWRGLATVANSTEAGVPMVMKFLNSDVKLAIEVSCGLVAQVLRMPVPEPAIVICQTEDLPGMDRDIVDQRPQVLCFGSHMRFEHGGLLHKNASDTVTEEHIWQQVCSTEAAPTGAVWDELIANADRHCENLLFDGDKWWLFDHDKALPPVADLMKDFTEAIARANASTYAARVNWLATQVQERLADVAPMLKKSGELSKRMKEIEILRQRVATWPKIDPSIDAIASICVVVIGLIALRLPTLAYLLDRRLTRPTPSPLRWSAS